MLEITGTILALIYVVLAALKNRLCWIFCVISAAIYLFVFWQSALYNLALLQIFVIFSASYGFFSWNSDKETNFSFLSIKSSLAIAALTLILGTLNYEICKHFMPSQVKILDSYLATASVVASLLASFRKIDSWIYWMIINSLSVYLFINMTLYPTAAVYFIFLILSFYGLKSWKNIN